MFIRPVVSKKVKPHSIYEPSRARQLAECASLGAVWFAVGWLFFQNAAASVALCVYGIWSGRSRLDAYVEKRKRLIAAQFEQMLYAVSSALQAGKSVENAFRAAEEDLNMMFGGTRPLVLQELESLNRKVENGTSLERAADEFQLRLDLPEAAQWFDIFAVCKRTGGDLVQVMRHASRTIVEKINAEREISVLIAGKRFEARALTVAPFIIVAVFRYGSPDYVAPLYEGAGRLVMAVSLLLLVAGMRVSGRLMRIEV